MKPLFLASVAVVGLIGASAFASDLPTKAPVKRAPVATPSYNWSCFYVGANFGGGWTNGSLNIPGNNFYGGLTEFIGGVQAGYNYRAGQLLLGIEGDFDWSPDSSGCDIGDCEQPLDQHSGGARRHRG
jgi:hypothetical protein